MKLRDGKKYETADGLVYRVRKHPEYVDIWYVSDDVDESWNESGIGFYNHTNLIRRHYTKPKPAHKLDLKEGDVVKLVAWEDGFHGAIGDKITCGKDGKLYHSDFVLDRCPTGHRPLFRMVSRA